MFATKYRYKYCLAHILKLLKIMINIGLAEREGFEPSVPRKEDNGFRDRPDRPLRHLSIRTAARAYHGPPANIKRTKGKPEPGCSGAAKTKIIRRRAKLRRAVPGRLAFQRQERRER